MQRFGERIAVLIGDLAHSEMDYLVASLPSPIRAIWRHLVKLNPDLFEGRAALHPLEHFSKLRVEKAMALRWR